MDSDQLLTLIQGGLRSLSDPSMIASDQVHDELRPMMDSDPLWTDILCIDNKVANVILRLLARYD